MLYLFLRSQDQVCKQCNQKYNSNFPICVFPVLVFPRIISIIYETRNNSNCQSISWNTKRFESLKREMIRGSWLRFWLNLWEKVSCWSGSGSTTEPIEGFMRWANWNWWYSLNWFTLQICNKSWLIDGSARLCTDFQIVKECSSKKLWNQQAARSTGNQSRCVEHSNWLIVFPGRFSRYFCWLPSERFSLSINSGARSSHAWWNATKLNKKWIRSF